MIKKLLQKLFNNNVDPSIIIDAINDYRNDGKKLMFDLGNKYNLDIRNYQEYDSLISRSNVLVPRQGTLSKQWNYYFHGAECGFYNKKNKQEVEVVLINSPEFGYLNSWFLLSYMKSTEKYKDFIEGIKWQELELIIDKLYQTGEIECVQNKN